MRKALWASSFAAVLALGSALLPPRSPSPALGATRSPSLATVDANARAAGNRRATAVALGTRLFSRVWPVQILKVRVDGVGRHEVAGLVLSGVKFHARVDAHAFLAEVAALVGSSFASAPVEEVDVWATTPLDVARGTVVAGDNAQPTARIVFATTALRAQAPTIAARLASGGGVYWNASWKRSLAAAARPERQGRTRRLGVAGDVIVWPCLGARIV